MRDEGYRISSFMLGSVLIPFLGTRGSNNNFMTDYTLQKVVERIRDDIDLSESFLSDEYYYLSLIHI